MVTGGGVLLAVNSPIPCKQLDVPVNVKVVTIQLDFSILIFVIMFCVSHLSLVMNTIYIELQ